VDFDRWISIVIGDPGVNDDRQFYGTLLEDELEYPLRYLGP